jgi:hypothetical protein
VGEAHVDGGGFQPVLEVAGILAGLDRPWYVAGGWAIDFYLGRRGRDHKDVDIAVFRQDQLAFQGYLTDRGWTLRKYVGNSEELGPWRLGEYLELPDRGALAEPADTGMPSVDLLLSEAEGGRWWFHADPRITHPLDTIGMRSPQGVPILCPEVVLLFKSRHVYLADDPSSLRHRKGDEEDFEAICGSLTAESRAWLAAALGLLQPSHPWPERLRQYDSRR